MVTSSIYTGAAEPLTVLYDADCGFCEWSARVLGRLSRRHRLRLIPLASASLPGQPSLETLVTGLHAVDSDGQWFVGADACLEIADLIPLLRPLARLALVPHVWKHLELTYRMVASHRHRLSRLLGLSACPSPRSPRAGG
jgi:predicted DCC family thiol-disulfide oxidoreductase YuxK